MVDSQAKIVGNGLSMTLMVIGLIGSIIGISTDYWTIATADDPSLGTVKLREGLWRLCITALEDDPAPETVCAYWPTSDLASWFHATRALMIISLIPFVVSFPALWATCTNDGLNSSRALIIIGTSSLAEAILQIVGLLVYYFELDPNNHGGKLGWSFYVCCGSAIVLAVGGLSYFMNAAAVNYGRRDYRLINYMML